MTYKFSPSSLSLLKDCPRCFWLKFNKDIKRPDTIFPSLPSGMDKILKVHFDFFMKKRELPPELSELKGYKLFDDEELLKIWRIKSPFNEPENRVKVTPVSYRVVINLKEK